jgi:hypothetical protein
MQHYRFVIFDDRFRFLESGFVSGRKDGCGAEKLGPVIIILFVSDRCQLAANNFQAQKILERG